MEDSEFLQIIRDVLGLRKRLDAARFDFTSAPAHLRLAMREELRDLQKKVAEALAKLNQ